MAPQTRSTQASATIYHRVHANSNKISKSEKNLHEAVTRAFEGGIKQGKREKEVRVTVSAADLSDVLKKFRQQEEEKEEKQELLELAKWEGRYTDYLGLGLAKVKQTRAWRAEPTVQGMSWVTFKTQILSLPLTDKGAKRIRNALKAAAKEAGFTYQTVLTAIDIYADRCSSAIHHAGLQQLVHEANFKSLAVRIDSDFNDITTSTPRSHQRAIMPVKEMIKAYKSSWFTTFKGADDYTLTTAGNDAMTAANNRRIV